MKLKEMIPGKRYVVTTNGSTLMKGEHVYIDKRDGSLVSHEACGWLLPDEWKCLRNEVELDLEYYKNLVEKKEKELKEAQFQYDKIRAEAQFSEEK